VLDAASEFFEHCQRDLVQLLLLDSPGSARCVALAVTTASGPGSFQTDLKHTGSGAVKRRIQTRTPAGFFPRVGNKGL